MLSTILRGVGTALDGIGVALCAFDTEDCALAWNNSFLEFFPEHVGRVFVGEPYAENLRRFYATRLSDTELSLMGQYISAGIERHRTQRRAYEFDHHNYRVQVAAYDLGKWGRVRVWRKVKDILPPEVARASSLRPRFDPSASLLLERIGDGVLVVDSGDHIVWANRTFLTLYRLASVEDAIGRSFEDIYRDAWWSHSQMVGLDALLKTLKEHQRFSGAPYEIELPAERWVRVIEQRGDEVDGHGYFVHADITTQKRQQQALRDAQQRARESEDRYRLLAEYSSDVTVAVSDGVVSYISPAVHELLGWEPDEVVGKTIEHFCHADDAAIVAEALQGLRGAPLADYRARALRADGQYVWVEARARLTKTQAANEVPVLVINVRNIAARKATEDELAKAHARLEAMATTDGLTGVVNRRRFDELLDAECRRASRDTSPLTLLLIDVDHFKRVNDTYGHQVGDDVLRAIAAALTSVGRRAGDVIARYGGEEFALLLPNTPPTCAEKLAGLVHEAVRGIDRATLAMDPASTLTVSIGVACTDHVPEGAAPKDLVRLADDALRCAKSGGRNRTRLSW